MTPKVSKLNVPEKPRKLVVFPQKIGSLVINGFHHGREESNYEEIESGEELQTFDLTREFALKQMIKDRCYDFDDELISFPQSKNRKLGSIVLHACNDDDKRSDLEYEVRLFITIFIVSALCLEVITTSLSRSLIIDAVCKTDFSKGD